MFTKLHRLRQAQGVDRLQISYFEGWRNLSQGKSHLWTLMVAIDSDKICKVDSFSGVLRDSQGVCRLQVDAFLQVPQK